MHNSKNCCTFALGKPFVFVIIKKRTPRNDLAVTAGRFFVAFFRFYVAKLIKNKKKQKKIKKNAKKFAYIKKMLYLCTRFQNKEIGNTKK